MNDGQEERSPKPQDQERAALSPVSGGLFRDEGTVQTQVSSSADNGMQSGTGTTSTSSPKTSPAGTSTVQMQQAEISWVANGGITHTHAVAWRLRMMGLSALLGVLIFLVTGGDWISAGSVVMVGILFGLLGSRRTQNLAYQLDTHGILVGRKHYAYTEFRAFSILEDRTVMAVELVPLRRFMPVVLLHLDRQQSDRILEVLSQHLPFQQHRRDLVDHITNKVKI